MKVVCTVRQVVETDKPLAVKSEFEIGDWVEVYSGQNEGHVFCIKDIRYNADLHRFEYLYSSFLMGGWHGEKNVVLRERRKS